MAKGKKGLVGRETSESAAENVETPKPKQASLAGMENRKIPDLHKAAEAYVAARDRRMELTKAEVATKARVIEKMKEHKKETYLCDGMEITLVHEVENVKVKIHADESDGS